MTLVEPSCIVIDGINQQQPRAKVLRGGHHATARVEEQPPTKPGSLQRAVECETRQQHRWDDLRRAARDSFRELISARSSGAQAEVRQDSVVPAMPDEGAGSAVRLSVKSTSLQPFIQLGPAASKGAGRVSLGQGFRREWYLHHRCTNGGRFRANAARRRLGRGGLESDLHTASKYSAGRTISCVAAITFSARSVAASSMKVDIDCRAIDAASRMRFSLTRSARSAMRPDFGVRLAMYEQCTNKCRRALACAT